MYLSFQVKYAHTSMGEHLFVVGESPVLGQWQQEGARKMATSVQKYPKWTVSYPIYIPDRIIATNIVYKYLIIDQSVSNYLQYLLINLFHV